MHGVENYAKPFTEVESFEKILWWNKRVFFDVGWAMNLDDCWFKKENE